MWFKADDGFNQHPKVLSIPRRERCAAVGLWTLAGTWAAGQLTDGHVPEYMVEELSGTSEVAKALVDAELWEVVEGGYLFHDWLQYNPSAEEVRADQRRKHEAKVRAGRSGGLASGIARRKHGGSSDEAQRSNVEADEASRSRGEANGKQNEAPTRPDPIEKELTTSPQHAPRSGDYTPEFEEFWRHYPRKVEKADAFKAWRTALKRTDADTLVRAVRAYPFDASEPRYVKHAARWLNSRAYEDVPGVAPENATSPDGTPRPAFDRSLLPANGELWTDRQVDMVLGPDTVELEPPAGLDERDARQWLHTESQKRKTLRRREAQQLVGWRFES